MLTLDLVAEEDDGDPRESSWEDFLLRGGSCGQVAAVGSPGVGGRQRAGTDVSKLRAASKEPKVKTSSLPRGSELSWGRQSHLEAPKGHNTQQSLTPPAGTRIRTGRSRCASMDEVLSSRPAMIRSEFRSALRRCPTEEEAWGGGAPVQPGGGGAPVQRGGGGAPVQLQSLIAQRMQRAQELLEEMRLQELQKAPYLKAIDSPRLHHL
ncbi:pleckstrin homology domain-containing family O member 1-A-like, partial [Etheostoma cragini]|uniref:pleckstrin homology domain-containing family O member 1-A-like n=1 Tax=Etheostoma cragini TaxID=417921 RepID=UPI00155F301D